MTTACPCFGRNENCRLCGGSGIITAEVEAAAIRSLQQSLRFGGGSLEATRAQIAAFTPSVREAAQQKRLKLQAAREEKFEAKKILEAAKLKIVEAERLETAKAASLKKREQYAKYQEMWEAEKLAKQTPAGKRKEERRLKAIATLIRQGSRRV